MSHGNVTPLVQVDIAIVDGTSAREISKSHVYLPWVYFAYNVSPVISQRQRAMATCYVIQIRVISQRQPAMAPCYVIQIRGVIEVAKD